MRGVDKILQQESRNALLTSLTNSKFNVLLLAVRDGYTFIPSATSRTWPLT
jgi:hypothetical protein